MQSQTEIVSSAPEFAYQFESYQVCPDSRQLERDFLCAVASLENYSDHPMATEIVQIAKLNNILPVSVTGFQCFPNGGLGGVLTIPGESQPRAMVVGPREFVLETGLQIPELLEATARQSPPSPSAELVYAGWDGWVRGILKFSKKQV